MYLCPGAVFWDLENVTAIGPAFWFRICHKTHDTNSGRSRLLVYIMVGFWAPILGLEIQGAKTHLTTHKMETVS